MAERAKTTKNARRKPEKAAQSEPRRRAGRPKGKATKSASFRLPEPLLEQLAAEAELQERSQTTILKRALEAYLAKQSETDREE